MHHSPGPAAPVLLHTGHWLVIALVLAAAAAYLAATIALWLRDTDWPMRRPALWAAGLLTAAAGLVGPVAERAHHDFTGHMLGHLLVGMLAPLLLVLAAPVTLALRALPVRAARRLARLLRRRPVAVAAHPPVAAVLNIGGLWVLYRTDLYAATLTSPLLHALVHAHVLAAGCLFTFAVLGGPDPAPHRVGPAWRAAVLVAAVAAHNVLAKTLYAYPPTGVPVEQAHAGAQLMYYGGAPVEVCLIVLLCRSWFARPRAGQPC